MGFNWGGFAGGAAEGFNKTYKMLKDEEERELLMEERRQALETKRLSREAARDTIGRAGSEIQDQNLQTYGGMGSAQAKALDAQTAGMDDQAGIARQTIESARYAQGAPDTAIPADLKGRTYTEAEAMGDYGRRMAAIDPEKAIAVNLQGRQIRKLDRDEKKEVELDNLADETGKHLTSIQTLSPDMGLYGLAQVAKKNGLTVDFVEAKDERSPGKIVYTGPDGKKAEITSFADGQKALGSYVMQRYLDKTQLYMPPEKAMAMMKDRLTMRLSENADRRAEEEAPGKRELTAAQTRKANAEAKTEGAKEENYRANADYLRSNKGKDTREVSNKDVLDFVKENGDAPSDVPDPKTGKPLSVRNLPFAEQRRLAIEFYTGKPIGGMPDVPKGGLKRPEPAAARQTSAPRRFDGQKFGVLTPQSMIDEAAAAGNPDAIRYKQLQEERRNLPLNAGLPY